MKMKVVFFVSFTMFLIGCKPTVNIDDERAAVSERFNQHTYAIQDEDLEALDNVLCEDPDMIFFGTDAQERWVGKNAVMAAQKAFFEATSESKIETLNSTIKLSKSGTVAWTSCIWNWDVTSGDQPLHLEGLRFTAVFEKRDNIWVVVQGHGSVPVSGQMVE
jgi:ketosteroid isomerase-like protein